MHKLHSSGYTDLGLSQQEADEILRVLKREPNALELGVIAAMWSEHCSYKSTRHLLAKLPSSGAGIAVASGENAGAVDIGNGYLAVFKIESHNHPSFIEPHHGAATGVGGILRDIFAMGAKPIAAANCLRFGAWDHHLTPALLRGVVAGVGGYANSFGVPTVTGETEFDRAYNGNILVNAFALGVVRADRLASSRAPRSGLLVLHLGSATGPDGIGGAVMASDAFGHTTVQLRPQVQIGDPFTGKKLSQAVLALIEQGLVEAVQDMGAAGLTSSTIECAHKGGVGIRLDIDRIPKRGELSALDCMLSESQERMLLLVSEEKLKAVTDVTDSFQLDCLEIGTTIAADSVDGPLLEIFQHGKQIADLPLELLAQAPLANHPSSALPKKDAVSQNAVSQNAVNQDATKPSELSISSTLKKLLLHPNLGNKSSVWEQYDWLVQGRALSTPAAEAGVIDVPEAQCALAIATSGIPRYCRLNAKLGAMHCVAMAWRKVACTGAKPLALTNNLNFASPKNPHIMRQIEDSIDGIKDAALALSCPVISGNVSLYNQTDEQPIPPTPVIAVVGRLDNASKPIPNYPQNTPQKNTKENAQENSNANTNANTNANSKKQELSLVMLGNVHACGNTCGVLGSRYLETMNEDTTENIAEQQGANQVLATELTAASLPNLALDFKLEKLCADLLGELWRDEKISSASVISSGGLIYSCAMIAIAGTRAETRAGNCDLIIDAKVPDGVDQRAWYFGEAHPRYLLSTQNPELVLSAAAASNVPALKVGSLVDASVEASVENKSSPSLIIGLINGKNDSIIIDELRSAFNRSLALLWSQ